MTDNKTDKVISMEEFNNEEPVNVDIKEHTKTILDTALEAGLDQVIVCGIKDDKFFVSSSCKDVQTAVFLSGLFTNSMYNGLD